MKEEELHEAFLSDLSALLKKYDATLVTEFRSDGYAGYNHIEVWAIDFNGVYEEGKERPYSQLDLPRFLD